MSTSMTLVLKLELVELILCRFIIWQLFYDTMICFFLLKIANIWVLALNLAHLSPRQSQLESNLYQFCKPMQFFLPYLLFIFIRLQKIYFQKMCLKFGGSNQIQLKSYQQNSHHSELWAKIYFLSTQLLQTEKLRSL